MSRELLLTEAEMSGLSAQAEADLDALAHLMKLVLRLNLGRTLQTETARLAWRYAKTLASAADRPAVGPDDCSAGLRAARKELGT